ncbi:MAG: DHH family phosphoesterase [Firmicutes bacterium]|jgi:c-di-AMP phosphodiesterase-like protein|nr:DHH family phosphoesterase [Bacillota bacterium]NBI62625.1 DHH family phosphoesterase [Clostridiales bacterium]
MCASEIEKSLCEYAPTPLCIVNSQGKVSNISSKIGEVFIYDGIEGADVYALMGIKYSEIVQATEEERSLTLSRNDKTFKLLTAFVGTDAAEKSIVVYFFDVTNYETLKALHNQERSCMAIVNVDNFDELISTNGEDNQIQLSTRIDKVIRGWGAKMNASVVRYKDHLYLLVFEYRHYVKLSETKFPILDEARNLETESDFPVTLSIGLGIGGKSPAETEQYAADALDIALGRGGDQAVVKNIRRIEYFGGKAQTVEKRNKGKSRVIAHALRQLIDQSSRVLIMGHRNPDMDCFGASIGIFRIAASVKKEAHIVIGEYNEALASIYQAAKESEEYSFINGEKAMSLCDENTLVVVLDTHRPSLVECPQLLEGEKIVVIDHHRKAEEAIPHMILAYMEPYASSTSELVAEIIQYSGEKKTLKKMDAEALLAGITVDTNRFAVKTGVRTFEAASWLRRCGADTAAVKRYFQSDLDSFQIRAKCIANAVFLDGGIAMSVCQGENPNAQIVNSQVADELLTVKGIRATFVAGQNDRGQTVVSARSLGDLNVQVIMEKLGGGGHLNTAGAQVETSPEETLENLKAILEEFL